MTLGKWGQVRTYAASIHLFSSQVASPITMLASAKCQWRASGCIRRHSVEQFSVWIYFAFAHYDILSIFMPTPNSGSRLASSNSSPDQSFLIA